MASILVDEGKKYALNAAKKAAKDITGSSSKKKADKPLGDRDDPVDGLVRVAAAFVGFTSEAIQYRKDKKLQKTINSNSQVSPSTIKSPEMEADVSCLRDGGAPALPGPTSSTLDSNESIWRRDEGSQTTQNAAHFKSEVTARGFVRAYAPVLNTAGIDQATFLDFVDTFNKSLEPNPYLNVINLAGFAGEAAPDPFSLLIGLAVDVGTYALLEADSRNRSSRFLDRINAGFFMPRGLACFCATWRSDAESQEKLVTAVDFEGQTFEAPTETDFIHQARKAMLQKSSRDDMVNKLQQQIQERMKPCRGGFNWPEPAPLIFPSADETKAVMCTKPDGKPKGGFDRGEVWADNFSDRRAQAKWMQKNPGFNVAASMPKPEFKSRYADPNHPASSGDIVAFVTAGKWSTRGRVTAAEPVLIQASQDSDGERQKSGSGDERETRMATTTEPGEETEKDRNKKLKKEEKQRKKQLKKELELEKKRAKESGSKYSGNGFKSLFQKDVLYLIIVDIRPNPERSC
ncbi:Burnettramic acids biosynthesis cluster protein E like [Verticillium longisporum]|nr:Burnettramic acids biosynthesis cluster protein E like [Verticillium longisporum]